MGASPGVSESLAHLESVRKVAPRVKLRILLLFVPFPGFRRCGMKVEELELESYDFWSVVVPFARSRPVAVRSYIRGGYAVMQMWLVCAVSHFHKLEVVLRRRVVEHHLQHLVLVTDHDQFRQGSRG